MATVGNSVGDLREDIPLKTGTRSSSLCLCSDDFFNGSRFISIAFAVFTMVITVALLVQIYYGDYQVVPHGSVASDSRECSEIGTSILKQGGNAVDAAIATAFCLSVVNPHTTGLDSIGQMLIYNHRTRLNAEVVDFSSQIFRQGRLPKLVTSLAYIHRTYGNLPWGKIVSPSADIAKKGFFVSKQLETAVRNAHAENLFGPLQAGAKLNLVSLADTLANIAGLSNDELLHITESQALLKSEALNATFKNFNIYVPNTPSSGPLLLENLRRIENLNFTGDDIFQPDYVYKLAGASKTTYDEFNVTNTFHRGTATNVAVIDVNDIYVSLTIGMYAPFGSGAMTPEGYLLDVADTLLPCGRVPIILTDSRFICGRRMVLGADNIVIGSQVVTALLVSAENATSSIEIPRFDILGNGSIGLEDDRNPIFSDDSVKELERLVNLQSLKEPYSSCNIVEKIADDLNSHSDSRGGGIASRF